MNRVQSSGSGTPLNLVMKLFWMLETHSGEDVLGASRLGGLAEAIMKNRSLQNRVVQR